MSFLLYLYPYCGGVKLIGKIVEASIGQNLLGTMDETMGAILGVFKWMFMMSVVLYGYLISGIESVNGLE